MDVYALRLQEKHGEDILKKLNVQKNTIKQWKRAELEKLIAFYSQQNGENWVYTF